MNTKLKVIRQYHAAKLEMHRENVLVYTENASGVGEHSDITQTISKELEEMSKCHDVVEMLDTYFK